MKRKPWFTLIEMLIVIVILSILSTAILPKITGHLAKTRDFKRQQDLRVIATAIEAYQGNNWLTLPKDPPSSEQAKKFPQLLWPNSWGWKIHKPEIDKIRDLYALWSVKYLKSTLSPYLNVIPKDPQKSNHTRGLVYGCYEAMKRQKKTDCPSDTTTWWIENGEYFYIQLMTSYNTHGRTVLVAKVETPEAANRVGAWDLSFSTSRGNITYGNYHAPSNHKHFKNKHLKPKCTSITKWETIKKAQAGNTNCIYTDKSQLFYIIDIE